MKTWAHFILIFCIMIALLTAYTAEHFLHYPPCPLCLYQRYVFIALLVPVLIPLLRGLFWPILLISFLVNIYHIGLEQNLWQDIFSSCHPALITNGDLETFRMQFNEDPMKDCAEMGGKSWVSLPFFGPLP